MTSLPGWNRIEAALDDFAARGKVVTREEGRPLAHEFTCTKSRSKG